MKLKLLFLGIILFLLFLIVLYFTNYKENYFIKSYSVIFFEIVNYDSSNKVYKLKVVNKIDPNNTNNTILGVRLKIEFISNELEGIKDFFSYHEQGDKGHLDSIKNIRILNLNNQDISFYAKGTMQSSDFNLDNSEIILPITSNSVKNCFVGNSIKKLSELLTTYNQSKYFNPKLRDVFLLRLTTESISKKNNYIFDNIRVEISK